MGTETTLLAEREELRRTIRSFLAAHSPESEVRRLMAEPEGVDLQVWRRMAAELGVQGLAVPEAYGGSGFGLGELQIVFEEAGAALLCAPLLSSAVIATKLILATGDDAACSDHLPALCDGTSIATVASAGADGGWRAGTGCTAVADADSHRVTGRVEFVPDITAADLVLVCADSGDGPSFFAVAADAPGVTVGSRDNLDTTRRLGWAEFTSAPARLLGTPGRAPEYLDKALIPAYIALAAEQAGAARRVLDLAVEYAKVRQQFGRLIGSFQAVKQKCSEVLMAVESATSSARAAGSAYDNGSEESAVLAHLALAQCSEAFVFAATETIQVHGGTGFTWEHPAHLYYKRAIASSVLFGTPSAHRERMLAELAR